VSRDQQGQKVYVDERERGQCVARERDLFFLFKVRGWLEREISFFFSKSGGGYFVFKR
jgi:hypothetical protein